MAERKAVLDKLRDERKAREIARIEMLHQLNLKKYNTDGSNSSIVSSKSYVSQKPSTSFANCADKHKSLVPVVTKRNDRAMKRFNTLSGPSTIPVPPKAGNTRLATAPVPCMYDHIQNGKRQPQPQKLDIQARVPEKPKPLEKNVRMSTFGKSPLGKPFNATMIDKNIKSTAPTRAVSVDTKLAQNNPILMRKSVAPRLGYQKPLTNRSPNVNKTRQNLTLSPNLEKKKLTVFERLYQPKLKSKPLDTHDAGRIKKSPKYLEKSLKNTHLILDNNHTLLQRPETSHQRVRRSISAIHFKRINKNDITDCIRKWSSIGDKLDKVSIEDINEDENVKQDKIVSAVKSDYKKAKFHTPVPNLYTPRPDELKRRLQTWLKKRGKSMNCYHHLQCFGINHSAKKEIQPLNLEKPNFAEDLNVQIIVEDVNRDTFEVFDDDNKENEPLASDSDNDSYTDNINDRVDDFKLQWGQNKWRKASCLDLNDTQNSMSSFSLATPASSIAALATTKHHVEELLAGALNELTELLNEGFDWEQSASWLRAIRARFPDCVDTAVYWECRAALEEKRGDVPASMQCWEQAVTKGTQPSVVEANLDTLLEKFMQLNLSPTSARKRQPDPKMVDKKNVFKSTLIRFAVQQAKSRQSEAVYTVTPVRRSARLSVAGQWSANPKSNISSVPRNPRISSSVPRAKPERTPLTVCTSIKQAVQERPWTFLPNETLTRTP